MTLLSLFAIPARLRTVIFGAAVGTAFEWYDFFVFGTLAVVMSPLFYSPALGDTGAFLAALATYGAGLLLRPFGALLFGRMGDTVGRKRTFMVTMTLMGVATTGVGLLPTYAQAGVWSPILLVTLRCVQGLALGGEYGGAAIFVAEHAPAGARGRMTGWIQICASLGFLLSLAVVLACQQALGQHAFAEWGWRIPFLLSLLLLLLAVHLRRRLQESPVFARMLAAGHRPRRPLRDCFGNPLYRRRMLAALLGAVAGVGIVWYTGQFYALFFLQKTLKMDFVQAHTLLGTALLLALPGYVVAGAASDRWGRKTVMLGTLGVAALTYVPLFHALTAAANPALARAAASAPVIVQAPDCHFQWGTRGASPCDRLRDWLASQGIPHRHSTAATLRLEVGGQVVADTSVAGLAAALRAAGYPERADPAQVNQPLVILLLWIMLMYVCFSYGPVAAMLVELFPTHIRYSAVSFPYHIGTGYFGGFMLYFSSLAVSETGRIEWGLAYPVGIALMSVIIGALALPETAGTPLDAEDAEDGGHAATI